MIFGYISRAEHIRQVSNAENARDQWWHQSTGRLTEANADLVRIVERERDRYDALLRQFTTLRLAGAVDPTPPPPVREPAKPDPVTQAIILKAGNSITLRKHYTQYVAMQRQLQTSDEEIAAAIMQGHSDDAEGVAG